MKKIFSFLLFSILSLSCFASGIDGTEGQTLGSTLGSTVSAKDSWKDVFPSGLTFFADYEKGSCWNGNNSLHAKYSLGSPLATVGTITRSASAPATKICKDGIIRLVTDSNTLRTTEGYYDATGFHLQKSVMMEPSGTNLLIRTDGTAYSATTWTGWSTYVDITGTATYSVVLNPELSSIASSKSQRIVYSGIATDTNKFIRFQSSRTGTDAILQSNIVTVSFYARSQTGCSNLVVKINSEVVNSANSFLEAFSGSDISGSLSPTWKKFSNTFTVAAATASKCNLELSITGISNGDVADVEISCAQIEKSPFATSFIPTTTAALTRPSESEALEYPATSNYNMLGDSGTIYAKFSMPYTYTQQKTDYAPSFFRAYYDANNQHALRVGTVSGSGDVAFQCISSTSSYNDAALFGSFNWQAGQTYVVAASFSTTPDTNGKYLKLYVDGTLVGTSATQYRKPVGAATAFKVFRTDTTNGKKVQLYNRRHTDSEVLAVSNWLKNN